VPKTSAARGRNPRGKGERLREEIVTTALRLLDELADDQALSLRAVARETGIAATSVYLHFEDRDTLVLAALRRCHADLARTMDEAAPRSQDPVEQLRARTLALGTWAYDHPGLYKVLHESTLNQRADMPFKEELIARRVAEVQRCMDLGRAPVDDAATVALDLQAAVHGAVSMRVNEPARDWPPLEEQVTRFLEKLVGVDVNQG
jgi:AcrR family transcriptional regulator